jgi:O-antigen ligase
MKTIFLLLIVFTQVTSAIFFLPGVIDLGASYFRLILFLSALFFILPQNYRLSESAIQPIYVLTFLAFYMSAGVFFSANINGVFREVSYVLETILIIHVLDHLIRQDGDIVFVARLFATVAAFIALYAYYEIETGNHLNTNFHPLDFVTPELQYRLVGQAWVIFGNPNDLCVHLILGFCTSVYALLKRKHFFDLLLSLFLCISVISISTSLSSRTVILSAAVFILTLVLYRQSKKMLLISGAAVVVALIYYGDQFTMLLTFQNADNFTTDHSSIIRARLFFISLDMFKESFGFGMGAGSFEEFVVNKGYFNWTSGIVNPHNAYGRVIAESGWLGYLAFMFVLVFPFFSTLRNLRPSVENALIISGTTVLIFALTVSSNPFSSSSIHLFVGIIWVLLRISRDQIEAINPKNMQSPFSRRIEVYN